jgi:signal peptidase I
MSGMPTSGAERRSSLAQPVGGRVKRLAGRLGRAVIWAAVAGALALAAAVLLPAVLGYERYVITGGSMGGTYDRGALLFAKAVPVEDLRVGDVITYDPPSKAHTQGPITHRIVAIESKRGERVFRTRGDANAARDPWHFTLDQPTQARAVGAIPYLGYGLAVLGVRELRMLLIGLPALMIAFALVARLWREAGEEAARSHRVEVAPNAER